MSGMRRREVLALFGGAAAAWPVAARAQQAAMPVVGFLHSQSPEGYPEHFRRFRQGLRDSGYVEGENLAIEYRWAENQVERLPTLAAELVRRQVAVIAALGGHSSPLAAKAATTTIPIVFIAGDDPVRLGLVDSLARPGGNLTGINIFATELVAKRLELLRQLVPGATRVAVLVNPAVAATAEATVRDIEGSARATGLQIRVLNATNGREIDTAFATIARERADALFVGVGAPFGTRRVQLALLAAFHRVPTTFGLRDYVEAGGLMSYGASLRDAYRQAGTYIGRILKGAKPADLPVAQATKFEMLINADTARMLGLAIPPSLLALADEVIE
jgi:putative tryptophan/tyrosine transport system substrate-binding protein